MYVPDGPPRLQVLQHCHDSPMAGFGGRKTLELTSRHYWWKLVQTDRNSTKIERGFVLEKESTISTKNTRLRKTLERERERKREREREREREDDRERERDDDNRLYIIWRVSMK